MMEEGWISGLPDCCYCQKFLVLFKDLFFLTKNGNGMMITELDVLFHGLLKEVQHCNPSVIPDDVNVEEVYSTYQSLRWGATSEA